jgi:hypothetical protein
MINQSLEKGKGSIDLCTTKNLVLGVEATNKTAGFGVNVDAARPDTQGRGAPPKGMIVAAPSSKAMLSQP